MPLEKKFSTIAVAVLFLSPFSIISASDKPVCIEKIPHVRQKADFCGEACVEMWLKKLGSRLTQDDVFKRQRMLREGTLPWNRRFGTGPGSH